MTYVQFACILLDEGLTSVQIVALWNARPSWFGHRSDDVEEEDLRECARRNREKGHRFDEA